MSKWKVVLFNQETQEVENDCINDEIFNTEQDAQAYIDDVHENLLEELEVLSQCKQQESGSEYSFGNNDLVMQTEEVN